MVVPDAVLNRRQKKKEKTYEYEVKWQFKPIEHNVWVEKDTLIQMGYIKLVQREDERQAAMAGLMSKQLTQPSIEKHLADFGVDAESASHTQINQLSGGMKVKVVLAAAMWQNPHILILDEPPTIWTVMAWARLFSPLRTTREECSSFPTTKSSVTTWRRKNGS